MKAKEYLQQVTKLNMMIQNKLIEFEQWKSLALGTSSRSAFERVQASTSQQKMADAVAKYVDMESELNVQIDKLVELKQTIIKDIEKLPANEYDFLHKMYIQGMELDEVAAIKGKSYSWATTFHGSALKHLQIILDEREKSEEDMILNT